MIVKRCNISSGYGKILWGRLVRRLSNTCLQLHGGEGYCSGHYAERFFRDARALSLAGD
ncbi:MAG: hypothetical protein H0A76_06785 [Candidatus Thiodubiliella endoseptemdiera]|uniref:Acyl-CoA dehydrogenase/oxidase C-terminal domain-containing protein n=1 Tax=Candidatus Thiodubiliella endoseptemdiera TaxID=2738886 RepID=A0A853F238_9GAMM|nr:hypothetical protein [Candidatus Thiodubiliella endoseptemdiera]